MQSGPAHESIGPNDAVRFLLELFALFSLGFWGFVAWPVPWSVAFGILAPLCAGVLWGLFRAPRARVPLGITGRVLVELIVMGGAAAAWFVLDRRYIGLAFAIIELVSGAVNLRAEIARSKAA